MTKYRKSHTECEWSGGICKFLSKQKKLLHVHHILPKHKYPEYIDGNYHGRTGNNFICFCPFHHLAYHYAYSTKRNDEKHQSALTFLWYKTKQWADKNKNFYGRFRNRTSTNTTIKSNFILIMGKKIKHNSEI